MDYINKLFKGSGAIYAILFIGLIVYTELLVLLVQKFPSFDVREFSEIFYNISVGSAAILLGIAGFKLLNDFSTQWGAEWREKVFKNKYSPALIGSTFNLIESGDFPGKVYIWDFSENKKFQIASGATFTDFGFSYNKVITLDPTNFNNIQEGEPILTKGGWGS